MTSSEYDDETQIRENNKNKDKEDPENELHNRHHLFFSDEFEEAIISSVWFSKTIPRKKKNDQNSSLY